MKTTLCSSLRFLLFCGLFVSILILPPQLKAQNSGSPFSEKPKSDKNDDENLCKSTGKLATDKFCLYYKKYKANIDTNPANAAEYRNRMIDLLKVQIDEYHNDHVNGRVTNTKWLQTVLDILDVGLSFAGTIVGGVRPKTVLAATSIAFDKGRGRVNDRFALLQQQILINKMNTNRLNKWSIIVQRKSLGAGGNEYSWDAAKGDLQEYLFLGSFTNALNSLVEETGAEVVEAKANLNEIVKEVDERTFAFQLKIFDEYALPMSTDAEILSQKVTTLTANIQAESDPKKKAKLADELNETNIRLDDLRKRYESIIKDIVVGPDIIKITAFLKAKYGTNNDVFDSFNKVVSKVLTEPSSLTFTDYDYVLNSINEATDGDQGAETRLLTILQKYQ